MSEHTHSLQRVQWTCIRRNRRAAILALIFSLGVLLGGLREVVGASARASLAPDPFMVRLALVDGTAILFYLFLSVPCIYERLWCAFAGLASAVMVLRSFHPYVAAPGSTELTIPILALWLAAVITSLVCVSSAFRGPPPGSAPPPPADQKAGGEGAKLRCSACGSPGLRRAGRAGGLSWCPSCSAELSYAGPSAWWSGLIGLFLAIAVGWLLGPTRATFVLACLAAWFPASLAASVALRFFLPRRPVLHRPIE